MSNDYYLSAIGLGNDLDLEKEDEYTFINFSKQFFKSAVIIDNSEKSFVLWNVIYYLYAHSLELSLKSYLYSCNNTSIKDLKKTGHNLEQALDECNKHDFETHVEVNEKYTNVVKLLNVTYSSKDFEYMRRTHKTFPPVWDVKEVAEKTLIGVGNKVSSTLLKNI